MEKATLESATQHSEEVEGVEMKLDKHGLPLVPQPTSHKDDPLVRLCSHFYTRSLLATDVVAIA